MLLLFLWIIIHNINRAPQCTKPTPNFPNHPYGPPALTLTIIVLTATHRNGSLCAGLAGRNNIVMATNKGDRYDTYAFLRCGDSDIHLPPGWIYEGGLYIYTESLCAVGYEFFIWIVVGK